MMPRKKDIGNGKTGSKAQRSKVEKVDKNTHKKGTEKSKEQDTQDHRPPKFKFVCQKCGLCCKNETISITFTDLDRWVVDDTIYRVTHLLRIEEVDGKLKIILKKDDDGICNLYHRDNKNCTIYETRPIFCRAFPLGFDGENYFLKSTKCKGLNRGEMTKDQLKAIRSDAFDEHIAARQVDRVFPILQGLILNKLLEQSKELMDKISDAKQNEELKE